MQFSNENSCSLTTSLWCVLTLRRVFTVCRLDFIWFGYSLSMNCIHYTPRSSCTGNRHTQTHIRTHLRLLTMFVLGHVDSWMKLSRKENTQCVERQQQKQRNETQRRIRRCLNVSRFIQSRVHFSLDVRRLWTLCYCVMVWWIHCVWRLMRTLKMYLLSTHWNLEKIFLLLIDYFFHSKMKRFLVYLICGLKPWSVKLKIQSENWLESGDFVVWKAHCLAPRLSKINN